jgi:hypothetical protein
VDFLRVMRVIFVRLLTFMMSMMLYRVASYEPAM